MFIRLGLLFAISLIITIESSGCNRGQDDGFNRIQFDFKVMDDAIAFFKLDTKRFPSSWNELLAGEGIADWKGPYLNRQPEDPWGRPYIYRHTGAGSVSYEIVTLGRDGKAGGEDENRDYSSYDFLENQ